MPLISMKNMSMSEVLEEEMYVGHFVASTGEFVQEHYILFFYFVSTPMAVQ